MRSVSTLRPVLEVLHGLIYFPHFSREAPAWAHGSRNRSEWKKNEELEDYWRLRRFSQSAYWAATPRLHGKKAILPP
jgi:hypothetical protein